MELMSTLYYDCLTQVKYKVPFFNYVPIIKRWYSVMLLTSWFSPPQRCRSPLYLWLFYG